jgi:hypothetical protein
VSNEVVHIQYWVVKATRVRTGRRCIVKVILTRDTEEDHEIVDETIDNYDHRRCIVKYQAFLSRRDKVIVKNKNMSFDGHPSKQYILQVKKIPIYESPNETEGYSSADELIRVKVINVWNQIYYLIKQVYDENKCDSMIVESLAKVSISNRMI